MISALGLEEPVLVGWSCGSFIISDYLRAYGADSISGINHVATAVMLNENPDNIGPVFINHVQGASVPDLPTNISTMRSFLRACTVQPISEADWETAGTVWHTRYGRILRP